MSELKYNIKSNIDVIEKQRNLDQSKSNIDKKQRNLDQYMLIVLTGEYSQAFTVQDFNPPLVLPLIGGGKNELSKHLPNLLDYKLNGINAVLGLENIGVLFWVRNEKNGGALLLPNKLHQNTLSRKDLYPKPQPDTCFTCFKDS